MLDKQTTKVPEEATYTKLDLKPKKSKSEKKKFAIGLSIKIIVLLLIIMITVRTPYVGSYPDAIIDYVCGQSKYALYALGIFIVIALIYNGRIARLIKTPKFIIFSIVGIFAIGCIISGSYDLVKYFKQHPTFTQRMNDYHSAWKTYLTNTSYSKFVNPFVSGGILAVMLSFLFNFVSYAVLVVFAVILLLISIFVILNINYKSFKIGLKFRGWLIRKLGGSFKYDGFDELKQNQFNQNKFKKRSKSELERVSNNLNYLDLNLLPDTDVNNDEQNWKKSNQIQTKLANLFSRENIDCIPSEINVYTSYSEICFEVKSQDEIKKIVDLQQEISSTSKLEKFNISFRGNIVRIEYDNFYFSKLSLRSVSAMYEKEPLLTFFGIDKNRKLVTQDFKLSPSALIIGKKGSGSATLTVLMMLTACYSLSPSDLDLVILNPNTELTYSEFVNMPHTSGKAYDNINAVTDQLHELQKIINQRASLLKLNNVDNIEQFNKINRDSTSKFKSILVVIPNVENAIKETFQNSKLIEDLLINGPRVGLYTILQSYSVSGEVLEPGIYKNVSDKYILSLQDQAQSAKIFGNYRGYQLHSNGDCLHFVKDKIKSMERLQICNLNKAELSADIEIAKTFYTIKKEQNEMALTEVKYDEQQII